MSSSTVSVAEQAADAEGPGSAWSRVVSTV